MTIPSRYWLMVLIAPISPNTAAGEVNPPTYQQQNTVANGHSSVFCQHDYEH